MVMFFTTQKKYFYFFDRLNAHNEGLFDAERGTSAAFWRPLQRVVQESRHAADHSPTFIARPESPTTQPL